MKKYFFVEENPKKSIKTDIEYLINRLEMRHDAEKLKK